MKNNIEERIAQAIQEYADGYEVSVDEAKEMLVEDYGKTALRGYLIGTADDCPELHIEKIDEMGVYADDLEAAEQAALDGVKLIPRNKQPRRYPYNCYRLIAM